MKKLIPVILLAPLLSSCFYLLLGGIGAGGAYYWAKGGLSRNYHQPIETAYEGTLHAMRIRKIDIKSQERGEFKGSIEGETSDGKSVTVKLEQWTDLETRVTVKAGAMGNNDIAVAIHKQIEKALR